MPSDSTPTPTISVTINGDAHEVPAGLTVRGLLAHLGLPATAAVERNLVLVPRADDLRRTLGRISVDGEAAVVRRIELRRSALQSVEILISAPRPSAPFAADELKRYFR